MNLDRFFSMFAPVIISKLPHFLAQAFFIKPFF